MPAKREPISKKTRFEVFKRDRFQCQYCGRSAPDVVLNVDHIKPVAGGGGSEIMNLVTSCAVCNAGKGKRRLTDGAEVAKQRKQAAILQERREQLEMQAEWVDEVMASRKAAAQRAVEEMNGHLVGRVLNDTGRSTLVRQIDRWSLLEVLEAIGIACDQYLYVLSDGTTDPSTISLALKKIGGICYNRRHRKEAWD